MKIITITQAFFKGFLKQIILGARIIAPQQLPPLYRLTLITLFVYILFGTISLAYKNAILLETYGTTRETKELKAKTSYYSSSLELINNKDFLDSYYREYFALTGDGEYLLLTTEQSAPKH